MVITLTEFQFKGAKVLYNVGKLVAISVYIVYSTVLYNFYTLTDPDKAFAERKNETNKNNGENSLYFTKFAEGFVPIKYLCSIDAVLFTHSSLIYIVTHSLLLVLSCSLLGLAYNFRKELGVDIPINLHKVNPI